MFCAVFWRNLYFCQNFKIRPFREINFFQIGNLGGEIIEHVILITGHLCIKMPPPPKKKPVEIKKTKKGLGQIFSLRMIFNLTFLGAICT
jgi:hypothetical protein